MHRLKGRALLFLVIILMSISLVFAETPSSLMSSARQQTKESKAENSAALTSQTTQTTPYGGTLRIGLLWNGVPRVPIDNLNPFLEPGSSFFYPLFSKLTRLDENCTLVPDLAQSWNISDDGLKYRFELFQNVTWHDGIPFNSSDVKYTVDTFLTDPDVNSYWHDWYNLTCVKSVSIVDAYSVEFQTDRPFPSLPTYLAAIPILPAHLYEGTSLLNNTYNSNPVGTGPFKFVSWTPGLSLGLEAFEGYFRGRPHLDGCVIKRYFSKGELSDALTANEIDLAPDVFDPYHIKEIENIPGLSVQLATGFGFNQLFINHNNIFLSDLRVRKAISFGINRSQLIDMQCLGYATIAIHGVPPSMEYWYNPNCSTYDYNPALANAILDSAGYSVGPDGWRFNLTLMYYSSPNTSIVIQDNLRALGIDVMLLKFDGNQFLQNLYTGNFEMVCPTEFIYDVPDPDFLSPLWHTNGSDNFGNYSNAQVDYLFESGQTDLNLSSRKQIYDELQTVLANDLPSIFLYHRQKINGHNNDFHGFSNTPIFMTSDTWTLERIWYDPTLSGEGNCPYRIRFIDDQGRITGFSNGTSLEQIPNSTYSGSESDPQLVKILMGLGNYTVELEGIENGTYSFELVNLALNYKHVSIASGAIQAGQIKQYFVSVYPNSSMQVSSTVPFDVYGDGKCDMRDIGRVAKVFGVNYPDLKYDPLCDIVFDWKIDMKDIGAVAWHFGEHL